MDMSVIEGETAADTIYAIDRVADDTLIDWFEQHWPDVELVSEGLEESVVVGRDPTWTVIVDPIDGTRGLMYDKRPAWCLAAAAPHGGLVARRRRRGDDRAADRQAGRGRPAQRDPGRRRRGRTGRSP